MLFRSAVAGDTVRLYYTSGCGNSGVKALKLTNVLLKTPAAPAKITITKLPILVCGQPRFRYSAPELPAATLTAGAATGYDWTFTGTLGSTAVIDSGDLQSQTFTVYFTSSDAWVEGDSIKVRYNSVCGYGAYKASKLANTLTGTQVPNAPASITQTLLSDVCGSRVYRYTAPALPAGTTTYAAGTGYFWTLATGSVGITGSIDSGSLYGRTIIVSYTSNAAASINDSIKVRFISACGAGLDKEAKLSNKAFVGTCGGNIPTARVEEKTIQITKSELYPNPNNGMFTLDVQTSAEGNQPALVQILDMSGRIVKSITTRSVNGSIKLNVLEHKVV